MVTSGELVSARLNEFAGWQVRVEWRPDLALPSGRYTGAVVLLEGDRELASVSVHATVFGSSGNPDAPRKSLAIGIDGLRSDGLARANTPNLDRLALGGASTLDASTQRTADTMSGPGWASILTGVEAEDHDVDGNADLGQIDRAFPTFLKRAKDGM